MKTEVDKPQELDLQSALMKLTTQKDIDPARLEKFMDLQFKFEDRQNERSFNKALADFQMECPVIKKTKKVSFNTTDYNYSPLDEIVFVIRPIMGKFGLSFSFDNEAKDGTKAKLYTTVMHSSGYSKKTTWDYDLMSQGGQMNTSQRNKSALTYAKRAGLENALGIVTTDEDDDAMRAIENPASPMEIKSLKEYVTLANANEKDLLTFFKVENYNEMNSYDVRRGISMLKQKVQQKEKECLKSSNANKAQTNGSKPASGK